MINPLPADEVLFDVLTPLGFRVRVTRVYWNLIVTVKHPVTAGREQAVKDTLQDPSEIRQSQSGVEVYLLNASGAGSAGWRSN